MPARTTTVRSPNGAVEVFAYLADFTHAADWHPDVLESRQVTTGEPTRIGARFHVVLGSAAWRTDRVFEVVDHIDQRTLVLQADTPTGMITETMSVIPKGDGCVVRYSSHSETRGLRILFAPLLQLALRRRSLRAGGELQRLLAL